MRSYAQLVSAGKQAARSQWTIGDLALEVETSYADHTLQNYADDIGVNLSTLQNYRTVSAAYEKSRRRDNLPWSVHQTFAALDDRYELLEQRQWTTAEARSEMVARAEREAQEASREVREAAEAARHEAARRELELTQEREERYRRTRERERVEEAAREQQLRETAEAVRREQENPPVPVLTEASTETPVEDTGVQEESAQDESAQDTREKRHGIHRRLSQICDILQDIRDQDDGALTDSEKQVLGAGVQFIRRLADGIQKNTR